MAKQLKAKKVKVVTLKVSVTLIKGIEIDKLGGAAQDVHQGIFVLNPTVFTGTKPVAELVLTDSITLFNSTRSAYKQGGTSAQLPYEEAHAALLVNLIAFKPYVDTIANGSEITLKLSMLPYSDGINDTGTLIKNGAVPTLLSYKPTTTGSVKVSCASFGKGAKFFCVATENDELPAGTYATLDGQLAFPNNALIPFYVINFNGKRNKTLVNLKPKTDYYLTFVMVCGGYVSNMSAALKIVCGN